MKKLTYIIAGSMALAPLINYGQDQGDALRYSQTTFGGTARFMAMGGAFCAVGGDMSTLTFNPAGIAVFTKSQLTFSPGFTFQSTNSTYNGTMSHASQASGNIQNAGWVGAWKNSHADALWKGLAFGIVYNRTNNFNTQIQVQGTNYNNSLLDVFTDMANSSNATYNNLDQFYSRPAFNTYLLDTLSGSNGVSYFNIIHPYLKNGSDYILQQKSVSTTGSMGETDISLGGNYNNKFYIGASLGIPSIRFTENDMYTETPMYTDTAFGLQSYTLNSTVATSGSGVNFKIGFIYRVTDWARIGFAVHTPTIFSLTDDYYNTLSATYSPSPYSGTGGTASVNSPDGSYNYTLTTPMRLMGGLAFVINHQGIISADYEYVDYSTASFSASDYSYSDVNRAISQSYMGASNLRVGAEWVLYPFSIRAGYSYYGNPYTAFALNSTVKSSYSAGLGIRIRHCFIDMAYVLTQYTNNYYLYDPSYGVNAAQNNTSISNIVFSIGANL